MQLNFAKNTLLFKTNSYFFCLVMDLQIVSVWVTSSPNADLFSYPGYIYYIYYDSLNVIAWEVKWAK